MVTVFDDEYLTEVYRRSRKRVLSYLSRRMEDREMAEDLFHEAFITFMERGEHVPFERVLFTLIFISKNKLRNYRRIIKELALFDLDLAFYPGEDKSKEIYEVIEAILTPGFLDEKSRNVFGLLRIMGKSPIQTGRATGLHRSSIYRRLFKVDAILRKVFILMRILPEDSERAKDIKVYQRQSEL